MKRIQLGQEVKDRVSGFRGIAVSRTTYLQGCNRIAIQPKVGKDGTLPEPRGFDEPDVEVVGPGVLPNIDEPPGGPRYIPPTRNALR